MGGASARVGDPAGPGPLLRGLDAAAPGVGVVRACTAVALPAGTRRTASELPAARLFVLEEGVVLVRSEGGAGARSMVIARCLPGSVLPRPAGGESFQSLTDAWLTAVPQSAWPEVLAVPELAERLVSGLEATILRQREAASALSGVRHVDRVRSQLRELAGDHGRVGRDGVRIDLPLTHELLADMVGCARETVTRALEELQRESFVVRRGRHYCLRVPPESLTAA